MSSRILAAAVMPLVRVCTAIALTSGYASSQAAMVAFDCAPDPKVTVEFLDDRAEVTVDRRAGDAPQKRVLQQQLWASGYKYAGDGLVLVGKGDGIDLTSDVAGEKPRHCRAVKRPSGS